MTDKERIDELEKRFIELARLVNMLEDEIIPILDECLKATKDYTKAVENHTQMLTRMFLRKMGREN